MGVALAARANVFWRPLLAVLSFSLLVVSLAVSAWIAASGASAGWIAASVAVAVASLVVGVLLYRDVSKTCEVEAARERVSALQEQERAASAYQRRLLDSEEDILAVRRRVADEIADAQRMVEDRNQDAASAHLSQALRLMGEGAYRLCDHPSVDAMASLKLRACEEAGVEGRFALDIPREVAVSPVDLCAVVGNLVDNGLEAAVRFRDETESEAALDLRAFVKGDYLVVEVENPVAAAEPGAGSRRARTVRSRGWGLLIVSSIAARYGGELVTGLEDERFRARAVLGVGESGA